MSDATMADAPIANPQLAAHTILVIDDQAEMLALVSHYLRSDGYAVLTAQSADAARRQIAATSPDLILLDVLMEDVNGFDLCREIKATPATMLIPVVMVTSLDGKEDRIRGIEAGCDEFLSKPVHRDELRARVRSLLKLQALRRMLEAERLAAEQAKQAALRVTFERYVAPSVVEQILAGGAESLMADAGARREAVALFADMRGFTRMSETLPPLDVVTILNRFFSTLTAAAHRHGGTIFSMAGDCLLMGFGVPLALADNQRSALLAARDIMQDSAPLLEEWQVQFGVQVGVGIGINCGEVIAGNIGSPSYTSYTVIGDTVNVAARLTDLARAGEIICAAPLHARADSMSDFLVQAREFEVALKGKAVPVRARGYRALTAGDSIAHRQPLPEAPAACMP